MAERSRFVSLWLYVIYNSPDDYPGEYVARAWLLDHPTSYMVRGTTLEDVRRQLPYGLTRIARDETDDPCIVETWL